MIRISTGTAAVLGLNSIQQMVQPTTAYIMFGEGCRNNCSFCTQAQSSTTHAEMLSRVSWPKADIDTVIQRLSVSGQFKRVCIQTVSCPDVDENLIPVVTELNKTGLSISVSMGIGAIEQAKQLLSAGVDVDKISLPIDAVTPRLYEQIKGGDVHADCQKIADMAQISDNIVTHIIVGLGETEQEACEFIGWCYQRNILPALFAFTPIKGTSLQHLPQPSIRSYRRIQVATELYRRNIAHDLTYGHGNISSFGLSDTELYRVLASSKAFETSGCSGCNRPFYNERPAGPWYNFPRALTPAEMDIAIRSALTMGKSSEGERCYEVEAT